MCNSLSMHLWPAIAWLQFDDKSRNSKRFQWLEAEELLYCFWIIDDKSFNHTQKRVVSGTSRALSFSHSAFLILITHSCSLYSHAFSLSTPYISLQSSFSPIFHYLCHSALGLPPALISYFRWLHLSLSHSLLLLTSRYSEVKKEPKETLAHWKVLGAGKQVFKFLNNKSVFMFYSC